MRRRKRSRNKKIILGVFISLICLMSVGYAAFQTNLKIIAKGNLKDINAAKFLKEKITDSGDGLYMDQLEDGRYVYKGANPNNYIDFNDEEWRIISIETDDTLKIVKSENIIVSKEYDETGNNEWTRPATLNTYLNEIYYNSLSEQATSQIITHDFNVGVTSWDSLLNNTDLSIYINQEKQTKWTGNVGLISASDYIESNSNFENCGSFKLYRNNINLCNTTNYLTKNETYWTMSHGNGTGDAIAILSSSVASYHRSSYTASVIPVVYLKSTIKLEGSGTQSKPYTIVNG